MPYYTFTIDLGEEDISEDEAWELSDALADCLEEHGVYEFLIHGIPKDEDQEEKMRRAS